MLNETFLLDAFEQTGNDLNELRELISEVSKATFFEPVLSGDLNILSFRRKEDEKRISFYKMAPRHMPTDTDGILGNHVVGVNTSSISGRGDFTSLIKEVVENSKFCLYNEKANKAYFASPTGVITSLERFGLNGMALLEPSIPRDLMIAECFKKDISCTAVIREFNGTKKIMALMSPKYGAIDQNIIFDILDRFPAEMGTPVCKKWNFTHFRTNVYVEFPEKAKELCALYKLPNAWIPGVMISTSDVGQNSLRVTGTWRHGDSITAHKTVSRKHVGAIVPEKLIKEVDSEIFSEYNKLPERLLELLSVSVEFEDIPKTIKRIFKEIKITDTLGKKRAKSLREALINEFSPLMEYSAYDIVTNIMSIPERVSMKEGYVLERLRKCCGMSPYVFDNKNSFKEEDEEELILVA